MILNFMVGYLLHGFKYAGAKAVVASDSLRSNKSASTEGLTILPHTPHVALRIVWLPGCPMSDTRPGTMGSGQ